MNLTQCIADLPATGGFTISPVTGEVPTIGYMVALTGHTAQLSMDLDTGTLTKEVNDYLSAEREIFSTIPNLFLGGWVEGGMLWLEPSTRVTSRTVAIELGRVTDQIAIFDVAAGETIPTNGNGGYLDIAR